MARKSPMRGNRRSGMLLITAVGLILAIIFAFNSINMKRRIKANTETIQELEASKQEQEELKADIQKQSEYIGSDEYIEEMAHDNGLVYDNEIIFRKED